MSYMFFKCHNPKCNYETSTGISEMTKCPKCGYEEDICVGWYQSGCIHSYPMYVKIWDNIDSIIKTLKTDCDKLRELKKTNKNLFMSKYEFTAKNKEIAKQLKKKLKEYQNEIEIKTQK